MSPADHLLCQEFGGRRLRWSILVCPGWYNSLWSLAAMVTIPVMLYSRRMKSAIKSRVESERIVARVAIP